MPMIRSPYMHLDPIDARIYMAVRDEGPLDRGALMARFPGEAMSVTLQRIDRLVDAGLLSEERVGQVRRLQVAPKTGRLDRWWTELRAKLRKEQPEP